MGEVISNSCSIGVSVLCRAVLLLLVQHCWVLLATLMHDASWSCCCLGLSLPSCWGLCQMCHQITSTVSGILENEVHLAFDEMKFSKIHMNTDTDTIKCACIYIQ
jgi:hypothetical protein